MTPQEKHIARLLIRSKIYESDKQTYEDLFVRVMQNSNPKFQPVKPQGAFGDRKNDGFDKDAGKYYQVYAPEDLQKNEDSALTKLNGDFTGLYDYWSGQGFNIKEYFFVVNDKFKGAYPTLHTRAGELAKEKSIKAEIFLAKHLEDTFLQLSDDRIIDVVGFIPDPLDIQAIDYDILTEVVKHLISIDAPVTNEVIPPDINFTNKIQFNSLSRATSDYLNSGRRQIFAVEDYFELSSDFVKDELRKKFSSLYNDAIDEIPDSETKSDDVFFFIRNKACPRQTLGVQNAVYVLMAYYFECCDIFETPALTS